jgi:hypothetical protein
MMDNRSVLKWYHRTARPRAATLMHSLPPLSRPAGRNGDFKRSRSAFSIILQDYTSKSVDTIRGYTSEMLIHETACEDTHIETARALATDEGKGEEYVSRTVGFIRQGK